MATFRVTTGSDVVSDLDGLLSLREALLAAEATPEDDRIVFARGIEGVTVGEPLVIASGRVRIDGDRDGDGRADVTIGGRTEVALISVGDAATVEIAGLRFAEALISQPGPATPFKAPSGQPGQDGETPFQFLAAAIVNQGSLTLERVDFADIDVIAPRAGAGGEGGDGFAGPTGADDQDPNGDGGRGGGGLPGGAGGAGGLQGGYAAGAVMNLGELRLRDVGVGPGVIALGGGGGPGGAGGRGGDGGAGGAGWPGFPGVQGGDGGPGGPGGDGGDGGHGGFGGAAANGFINLGSVDAVPAIGFASRLGGGGGFGGTAGAGGTPGTWGLPGSPGRDGDAGEEGLFDPFWLDNLGVSPAEAVDSLVFVHARRDAASEGGSLDFHIHRMGDSGTALSVAWAVARGGATDRADFDGPRRGTVEFAPGGADTQTVSLALARDGITEADEAFVFRLAAVGAAGGATAALGTREIRAVIRDADAPTRGDDALRGTDARDVIDGLAGDDAIRGLGGDDRLIGGRGDDALWGGAGDDRLEGGRGRDRLYGGRGEDLLIGGPGRDTLFGGGGPDTFRFASPGDAGRGRTRDEIGDFGRGDVIDLSRIDANETRGGNQAFRFLGDDPFTERAGELRYTGGVLRGDVDGDGRRDFEIALADAPGLRASDLLL